MATRVEAINPSGEDCHGLAGAREGRSVGHPVDSVGGTRDDREAAIDQPRGCLHRHVLAVACRGAGPDQGDRVLRCGERRVVSTQPECDRGMGPEVVDTSGPCRVARHEQAHREADRLPKGNEGDARLQPGGPPGEGRLEVCGGELRSGGGCGIHDARERPGVDQRGKRAARSETGHELTSGAVSRFCDAGPAGSREQLRHATTVGIGQSAHEPGDLRTVQSEHAHDGSFLGSKSEGSAQVECAPDMVGCGNRCARKVGDRPSQSQNPVVAAHREAAAFESTVD
jgi:hypothetical protein